MVKDAPRPTHILTGWRITYLFTLIVSGLVYIPAMSGLPIWDDHALIGGNGIGGGKSLTACFTEPFLLHYFRPLVSVTFFVDHKLFGPGPFFYHQTNLLIHVFTTLFCLALFRSAFQSRFVAVAGALAFAVQPAQVSTVAWIGGRTDSLCTLWVTIFAWGLIRAARAEGRSRFSWTALSTFAFGLALLTKEQAFSLLPLAPIAYRCFATGTPKDTWRAGMRYSIPYLITSAAFIIAWFTLYPSPMAPVTHGVVEQTALAGRTLTYYSALLVLPSPAALHLLSLGKLEHWGVWSILLGYAALLGMLALCLRSLNKNPAAAWFCAFAVAAVLPVCNLIPLPSLVVAPYRVGICGPAAAALIGCLFAHGFAAGMEIAQRRRSSRTGVAQSIPNAGSGSGQQAVLLGRLRLAAGALMLFWCAALTWWGAGQWQDERMIFGTIVRYDPDSIVARFNLTTALLKQHKMKPALTELDELMTRLFRSRAWMEKKTTLAALKSDSTILLRIRENQGNAIRPEGWLAALYGQRGFALLDSQDRTAAARSFAIGRAIDRSSDDINLGLAKMAYDGQDYHTAAGFLRLVLAVRPRRAEAHMLMGHTLAAMGHWNSARMELEAWAALQPWSGQAHMEIAQAKSRLGDYVGAQASLQYALSNSICDVQEVRARLRDLHGRAAQFLN